MEISLMNQLRKTLLGLSTAVCIMGFTAAAQAETLKIALAGPATGPVAQ